MVIAQAMIEEIFLPFDAGLAREVFFPVGDGCLQAGSFGNDRYGVQVIGHQEYEVTVPDGAIVIVFGCGENLFADGCGA